MEEKRTSLIIISIIVVAAIIIASFLIIKPDSSEIEGITAMEGGESAEKLAHDWHNDSQLVSLTLGGFHKDGKSTEWHYKYFSPSTSNEIDGLFFYDSVYINVNSNGSNGIENFTSMRVSPIINWTIDSDDAYNIAISRNDVKSFLKNDASVFLFQLSVDGNKSIWQIEWTYNTGIDNPRWAEIHIDANTGEVLFVEVDS